MKAYIASLLVKKCELYRVSCMQNNVKAYITSLLVNKCKLYRVTCMQTTLMFNIAGIKMALASALFSQTD